MDDQQRSEKGDEINSDTTSVSEFGFLLRQYLPRAGLNQIRLSQLTGISQKMISEMVTGKREQGTELRRHLYLIIDALVRNGGIISLAEANALMTAIPKVAPLDERDKDEKRLIEDLREIEVKKPHQHIFSQQPGPQPVDQSSEGRSRLQEDLFSGAITIPTPNHTHAQTQLPASEGEVDQRKKIRRQRYRNIGVILVGLALILTIAFPALSWSGWLSFFFQNTCSASQNGVTLYADPYFHGHCHTFPPGNYDLSQFGLDQNVSSLKDPFEAYDITLVDRTNRPGVFNQDILQLPADWNDQAHSLKVEKHRSSSCVPGSNGIIAFINTDYSGGCLFVTGNIPDLTPLNFDKVIVSIQFVGSYQNIKQLVLYRQPHYKDKCGAYWQDQSDLLQCARIALSVQVLSFTPPTPIPTLPGTPYAGNIAPKAMLSPQGASTVIDENLKTEWIGGHMAELDLYWAFPVTIHRIVVWDRKQSQTDNNQINALRLVFSDKTATGSINMVSLGPRCADVVFPEKTIRWLHIVPIDASGNNGYREVEVWATTGFQYSHNTCVNHVTVFQTIPLVGGNYDGTLYRLFSDVKGNLLYMRKKDDNETLFLTTHHRR